MSHSQQSAPANGDPALSPSLVAEGATAFELKFILSAEKAAAIESWARVNLKPDPHGNPDLAGSYEVSTLYLDTPRFDVFHNANELDGAKLRLRRYGDGQQVYLERKLRRGDKVRKRRTAATTTTLEQFSAASTRAVSPGDWFQQEVANRELRPVCRLTYLRTAFSGHAGHERLRLTLDRTIQCATASAWSVGRVTATNASQIAEGVVVCELKFESSLPQAFKHLIVEFGLASGRFSKYRQACLALGLIEGGGTDNA